MSDVKAISSSQLNYSNVENKQVSIDQFQNSRNVFNIFDEDGSGVLEDSEINNFFSSIDSNDGNKDNQLTTKGINAFMDSSALNNPQNAKEFVEFTNQLYQLTQEAEANIDLYSTIEQGGGNTPNGRIDSHFFQSSKIGDCWLLTQTHSLSETPWGADMIHQAIKQNENGDYLVSLDGVGEDIQISQAEFNNAQNYSKGEPDMVLIEMAVEKYIVNHQNDDDNVKKKLSLALEFASKGNPYHVLSSNYPKGKVSIQYLLGQKTGEYVSLYNLTSSTSMANLNSQELTTPKEQASNSSSVELERVLKDKAQNPAGSALICGFDIAKDKLQEYKARGIEPDHAYSLSSRMDGDNLTVVLTNPHNSANKIEISYQEFSQIVNQVAITK